MAVKKQAEAVTDVVVEDVPFDQVEGADLLIAPKDLTAPQTMRLMGRVQSVFNGVGDGETVGIDFELIADLIDFIGEHYAVDRKAFDDFGRGASRMGAMLELVTSYASELGKGED